MLYEEQCEEISRDLQNDPEVVQRENEGNVANEASMKALNDAYNVMYSVFPSEKVIVNPKERVCFMGTGKDPPR